MQLRTYAFQSDDYARALELRREVLRRPLGLTYDAETLAKEENDIHIGAFDREQVVGTLILTPDGEKVKMRQVAVAPERQGLGIGRLLVEFAEAEAVERGFKTMVLHARESATPFYERLGYTVEGEPFEEVTIPHISMYKHL